MILLTTPSRETFENIARLDKWKQNRYGEQNNELNND